MKRRELKKDIDFLVGEVISDCYTCMIINGEKNHDNIVGIMESVVNKRNELIEKTNKRFENKNAKEVKNYFRDIQKDLMSTVNDSFEKLSDVAKA